MEKQAAISIKGLSVSYDRKRVLSNIYLDINPGKVVGLVGPNGAGKTTLFLSILDLIEVNTGKVEILGTEVSKSRKILAYVPQKTDVDWSFPATVMDIVLMGRYPHKGIFERMNNNDRQIAEKSLDEMGMLEFKDRQIGQLSGGQQQRVFLARALCQEADIFLLDEPFVGVDMTTEESIIQILKKLATENKTLLVVHHDLATVDDYFDEVILLNQRLIAYGPISTTFTKENIKKAYGGQLPVLHEIRD